MKTKIIEKIKSEPGIIDCHTHVGLSYKNYLSDSFPYSMSFEDLVARMKLLGISRSMVFPFESSYYPLYEEGKNTELPIFSKFPYEKENKALFQEIYEVFPEFSEMAMPFAMFDPSNKVSEQIESLEELSAAYPLFGLKTVTTYIKSFLTDLNGKGSALLDFAEKKNIPFLLHVSYCPADPWASVFDAIEIVKANPSINFCLAHSARFVKSIFEEAMTLPNCFIDLSAFKIHCDLATTDCDAIPPVGERVEANYEKPEKVLKVLVENYSDTILWGTDTPYHYFMQKYVDGEGVLRANSLKSRYDTEINLLNSLTSEQIQKISFENTLKYLFK